MKAKGMARKAAIKAQKIAEAEAAEQSEEPPAKSNPSPKVEKGDQPPPKKRRKVVITDQTSIEKPSDNFPRAPVQNSATDPKSSSKAPTTKNHTSSSKVPRAKAKASTDGSKTKLSTASKTSERRRAKVHVP